MWLVLELVHSNNLQTSMTKENTTCRFKKTWRKINSLGKGCDFLIWYSGKMIPYWVWYSDRIFLKFILCRVPIYYYKIHSFARRICCYSQGKHCKNQSFLIYYIPTELTEKVIVICPKNKDRHYFIIFTIVFYFAKWTYNLGDYLRIEGRSENYTVR